ncbi:MAG: hypothetical protein K1X57_00070 [Gemmataceae bacterium]|nr:hypothetical protein [Gemmataceae bacterium]
MEQHPDPAATSWLDGVVALAALLLAGLLGSAVVRNADVWQHLATGRLISQGELAFGSDPYCFTTADQTWVNHAWGFDLGTFFIFDRTGASGIVLTRATIALVFAFAIMLAGRKGSGLALPATAAAVAVIAVNARLPFFQPALVSYALMAVLVAWLLRSESWPVWVSATGVFLIHAHWVNHDAWFILGPVAVFALAVGSVVESRGSAGRWLLLILAALAGTICNPWHIRAWTVPDELAPMFFDPAARIDRMFEPYFASPLDGSYSTRSGYAPAWAFYSLLVLGIISFSASFREIRWSRLTLWVLLAGLAIWRSRLVPFFAAGATPLMVLNFQDTWAVTPHTPNRRQVGLFARAGASLAVLGLAAMAWPGWLGPRPSDPTRAARVGLRMEVDPGVVSVAGELAKVPDAQRCFAASPEAAAIISWFAPGVKTYVDTRWRLHTPRIADFIAARSPFQALDQGSSADSTATEKIFRDAGVNSLVLVGSERSGSAAARALFLSPETFPLVAVAGRATAFRAKPGSAAIDPLALAFAPQAARPLAPLPLEDLKVPTEWEKYESGPPIRLPELDESGTWIDYASAVETRLTTGLQVAQLAGMAASAGQAPTLLRFPISVLASPRSTPPGDRLAAGVLAVRRARQARSERPDEAESSYRLALALQKFAGLESLSSLQFISAINQARARLPVGVAWGRDEAPLAFALAELAAGWHLSRNHRDLGLDQVKDAMRLMQLPEVASKFNAESWKQATKQLEQLDKEVNARRDEYDRRAANQPLMNRVYIAIRLELPGLALAEMQKAAGAADTAKELDPLVALDLMLQVGQAEEARKILRSQAFEPITAVDPEKRPVVRRLQLYAAAACGDDARAADEIAAVNELSRADEQESRKFATIAVASLAIGLDPVGQPVITRGFVSPIWTRSVEAAATAANASAQQFEMLAWRGLLALQAGDTRVARRSFAEALQIPAGPGRDVISLYHKLLDRAE